MTGDPPPPPTVEQLTAMIRRAADGEPLVADQPVEAGWWGLQTVDLASGWRLRIWWHPGQRLGPLHGAVAANGSAWTYGASRWPDWLAGPDSVPFDPIRHALGDQQRERLRQRLLSCSCWPEPELPPQPEPPTIDQLFPPEAWWERAPS